MNVEEKKGFTEKTYKSPKIKSNVYLMYEY